MTRLVFAAVAVLMELLLPNSVSRKRTRLFVIIRRPIKISRTPPAAPMYFSRSRDFSMRSDSFDANSPTTRKGVPRPKEKASSRAKADIGEDTARPKSEISRNPTQGVQPTAKAVPKINDEI